MTDEPCLITRDDIAGMEGVDKTHFLNPGARRINKSLGDAAGLTDFGFHVIEVQPGDESTEHHVHHHEDECVFVLSGTATARIGDETISVGAGDFIAHRKGGLPHSMKNTGAEVLRCIVVGARAPQDVVDYPRLGKRFYRQAGMASDVVDHDAITKVGGTVGKK